MVREDGIAFPPCFSYLVGKSQHRHDTFLRPLPQSDRHGGTIQSLCCLRYFQLLEHDPEKWMPVFRSGHIPDMNESATARPSRWRTQAFRTLLMAAETSVSRKSDAA